MNFRLANIDDKEKILKFIKNNWSSNHILVNDLDFFDYEMVVDKCPQYILAIDDECKLIGLLGFIKYGEEIKDSDLFLAMLRVLDEYSSMGVGLKLINYSKSITNKNVHCVGINPNVLPFYKLCKFSTSKMKQLYLVNPNLDDYFLLSSSVSLANQRVDNHHKHKVGYKVNEGDLYRLQSNNDINKSFYYFNKRYVNHPIYNYEIRLVNNSSIVVYRVIENNGSSCIRVVDYIGDLVFLKDAIEVVFSDLVKVGGEYLDLYIGSNESINEISGINVNNGVDIIPNYFEPFIKKNIDIFCATTSIKSSFMFKGDGDQDRPSFVLRRGKHD